MANDERDELDGRVKRGVEALRETGVAAGLTEELIRRTIEKARSNARDEGTLSLKRSWRMKIVRRFSMAAGFGVLVTGSALWLVWGRSAQVGFADVLTQVNQAQAVRCHMAAQVDNGKPLATSMDVLMVEPGWMVTDGRQGAVSVHMILNTTQGKMLMLMGNASSHGQAIVMDMKNIPEARRPPNLLEQFKQTNGKDSKPLGEKEIAGVKARGFEVIKQGSDMQIWADEKTELPVLVTMKSVASTMMGSVVTTFSDFDWNPTYDASELSFAIPAGYFEQKISVDVSDPTEADVVIMLKSLADLNDGVFPPGMAMKDLMPSFAKLKPTSHGTAPSDEAALQKEIMDKVMPMARGWGYMMRPAMGTDWMYAGNGAHSGEKGRVILWYKPAKGGLRAFDADFAVHDVKDAQLPAGGQPVNLDFAGAMRGLSQAATQSGEPPVK